MKGFLTLLLGAFIGALATNIFTRWRESDNRRREFRQFLGQWLHDIQRVSEGDVNKTYEVYVKGEREFAGYVAKLKGDFVIPFVFKRLSAPLQERLPHHIHNRDGDCREIIAKPIERPIWWI
jgi:hypothetical protein